MPKLPRGTTQDRVVRTFVKAGGIEIRGGGKGSHRTVEMPNGSTLTLPYHMRPGLLGAMIKQAGMTLEEFLEYW